MYSLIDGNSFYNSCHQVFRPDLRGKPVITVSNNDGCAVAVNNQAKALNIPKFEPYFKIKALCEQHGVTVFSSNYELYSSLSLRMMQVIARFGPEQLIYSIDESFLNLDKCINIPCLREHGAAIRKAIWKECRIPVCVGTGPTLTLSKLANHAAKKLPGYQGVCVLDSVKETQRVLQAIDVGSVWGIGRKRTKALQFMGITTAAQLANFSPSKARKEFDVGVERTIRELNGEKCIPFDIARADKQQVFSTRSLGKRITEFDELRQAISLHVGIASRKIRAQQSLCEVLVCFAGNSPFDEKPVSFKAIHKFEYATADVDTLTSAACALAKTLYKEGVQYYKVGVGLIDLVDGRHEQADLFNPQPNNAKLMASFDQINAKYGMDTIFLAAQGTPTRQSWGMRREMLSPQYTTKWSDLPRIAC
ncbi:Y-family DNA polymerase [Vibrio sp. 10N.222.51.C8]|uniref:Y-family DNA polymerase n=1 Tax=Vibrio sp. 10N.222.51.C8 TaxID=3229624 RepID=UPI00354F4855